MATSVSLIACHYVACRDCCIVVGSRRAEHVAARRCRARPRRPLPTPRRRPATRNRRHRIAHPPRPAEPGLAGGRARQGRRSPRPAFRPVADILQRLPSASGGLNSKVNNSGNLGNPPDGGGVGAGSAEIDLRYLSAKRTLVLVDGLRFVNGTSGSGIPATVDLNTIPANMIDRIEVLQAGASPLYGSDAIAGVVNVITVAAAGGPARLGPVRHVPARATATPRITSSATASSRPDDEHRLRRQLCEAGSRCARPIATISQFPNPGQTSCTDPGRRLQQRRGQRPLPDRLRQPDDLGTAPDNTPTFAELRPFTAGRPVQLRAVQLPPDAVGALRRLGQLQAAN